LFQVFFQILVTLLMIKISGGHIKGWRKAFQLLLCQMVAKKIYM